MKRALAIAVALCTLGFAGFSQIAIKGSWTASVCLVPAPTTLTSTLNLTYTVAGFDITSITGFGATGITSQKFTFKGVFGPFSASGNVWFQPSPAAYLAADAVTSFDFGGIAIGATIRHWTPGNWQWAPDTDPCAAQTPPGVGYLQYIFTGTISPLTIRARFADCCTGTAFQDLRISLTGIELCCGIKYNATIDFTKAGFQTLTLTGINIPLCCGISFDVSITYGVSSKSVSFTPKFAGIAEACFTVWGGPVAGPEGINNIWSGIRIDGYRIRCTLGDCNYLEYVHAFNPAAGTIPAAIRGKFLAACGEYEYLELGFCGAGCCGGKYEVTLRMLWGNVTPGLFGLTRFVGTAKVPVMANFTLNFDFVMPVSACAGASFCFGWTFSF